MLRWNLLVSDATLDEALKASFSTDVLLFKHSTTCSISLMAKMRLEESWDFSDDEVLPYYLDLKNYRDLSSKIATIFSVHHESPQVLLIRTGECIYDASHFDISTDELKETLAFHAQ